MQPREVALYLTKAMKEARHGSVPLRKLEMTLGMPQTPGRCSGEGLGNDLAWLAVLRPTRVLAQVLL